MIKCDENGIPRMIQSISIIPSDVLKGDREKLQITLFNGKINIVNYRGWILRSHPNRNAEMEFLYEKLEEMYSGQGLFKTHMWSGILK